MNGVTLPQRSFSPRCRASVTLPILIHSELDDRTMVLQRS
jgi:hypothetical protein